MHDIGAGSRGARTGADIAVYVLVTFHRQLATLAKVLNACHDEAFRDVHKVFTLCQHVDNRSFPVFQWIDRFAFFIII